MKNSSLAFPVTLITSILFLSSCSSPPVEGFDKKSLKVGQRYTWKGTVTEDGLVLVSSEQDQSGNRINYVADPKMKCKAGNVPAKGNEATVEGVLDDLSMTGTDYHYSADGARTATVSRYLVLRDCRVH